MIIIIIIIQIITPSLSRRNSARLKLNYQQNIHGYYILYDRNMNIINLLYLSDLQL